MVQSKEGSIVHVEIHSNDPPRTREFFANAFGWKFQDVPEMNYMLWEAPDKPAGGLQKPMEGRGPTVLNYLLSKEINADLGRVQHQGGLVLVPKSEIPNMGWFAIFQEPGGTVHALYQDMPKPPAPRKAAARKSAAKKAKARKKK